MEFNLMDVTQIPAVNNMCLTTQECCCTVINLSLVCTCCSLTDCCVNGTCLSPPVCPCDSEADPQTCLCVPKNIGCNEQVGEHPCGIDCCSNLQTCVSNLGYCECVNI